jgi:hypothetical protein
MKSTIVSNSLLPCPRIIPQIVLAGPTALGCLLIISSGAQTVNLSDQNSTAAIDGFGTRGLKSWAIQGWNFFEQQSYYFAVGNSAPRPLAGLSEPLIMQPNASQAQLTYLNAGYSVSLNYQLYGGTNVPIGPNYGVGTGRSALDQTMTVHNTSANSLTFHLYLYTSVFGYGGDTVFLNQGPLTGPTGGVTSAEQYDTAYPPAYDLKAVTSVGADHGEVAPYLLTLQKLTSGQPVTLNDDLGPATGNGYDPTWSLEWDVNILAGGSFSLVNSEVQSEIRNVPEPSSAGLLTAGLVGCWFYRRHQRAAVNGDHYGDHQQPAVGTFF